MLLFEVLSILIKTSSYLDDHFNLLPQRMSSTIRIWNKFITVPWYSFILCLLSPPLCVGVWSCIWSLFVMYIVLCDISSFAINFLRKRGLVALLSLCSCWRVAVTVMCLFFAVTEVGLGHIHSFLDLFFLISQNCGQWKTKKGRYDARRR